MKRLRTSYLHEILLKPRIYLIRGAQVFFIRELIELNECLSLAFVPFDAVHRINVQIKGSAKLR